MPSRSLFGIYYINMVKFEHLELCSVLVPFGIQISKHAVRQLYRYGLAPKYIYCSQNIHNSCVYFDIKFQGLHFYIP